MLAAQCEACSGRRSDSSRGSMLSRCRKSADLKLSFLSLVPGIPVGHVTLMLAPGSAAALVTVVHCPTDQLVASVKWHPAQYSHSSSFSAELSAGLQEMCSRCRILHLSPTSHSHPSSNTAQPARHSASQSHHVRRLTGRRPHTAGGLTQPPLTNTLCNLLSPAAAVPL